MFSLTIFLSKGLSSTKTIESNPIFNISWIYLMLLTLLSQFATKTAISSIFKTISGWCKNGSFAFISSFLLQTAMIIPLSFNSFAHNWIAEYILPNPKFPILIFSIPSSPIIPPQIVLSKSRIRHFLILPLIVFIISIVFFAIIGKKSTLKIISVVAYIFESKVKSYPYFEVSKAKSFINKFFLFWDKSINKKLIFLIW